MTKTSMSALRIAVYYGIFAAVWIRFSDIVLQATVSNVQILTELQTIKGWLFVMVTAALLFLLVRRGMNTIEERNRLDRLTGLLNHEMFKYEIQRKLNYLEGTQHLALIYLDIDDFAALNQKLGHEKADELLAEFSRNLRQHYSASVVLGRFPPDQFGIALVTHDPQSGLEHCIGELRQLFDRTMRFHQQSATCCIGVAVGPGDGNRAKMLMSAAADALRKAKQTDRDSLQFYNRELSDLKQKRLALLKDLKEALASQSLSVVYQPQYALKDMSLKGVEVLVRWQHPQHGFIPPDRFVEMAEENGLVQDISAFVIKQAEKELMEAELLGSEIPRVSINISALEFNKDELMDSLIKAVESTRLLKHHLVIEITETATLNNIEKSADSIRRLKTRGIQFSVDDFGTGYTSLAMLKDLPINEIKIDRFFVNDLEAGGRSHTIIEAIIGMSKSFGVNTVAEGIETQEQLDLLKQMGCDEAQGYYLAVPMDIRKLKTHLAPSMAIQH